VVRNADATTAKYSAVFGPGGYICAFGASVITAQHFRSAGANCGKHVK
jgi:hypothetical protein